jgi:hypothetical protein
MTTQAAVVLGAWVFAAAVSHSSTTTGWFTWIAFIAALALTGYYA